MTRTNYWPKAFAVSCLLHAALLPWLVFWSDLPARQETEQYVMLDLTVINRISDGAGGGGNSAGAVVEPVAAKASADNRELVETAPYSQQGEHEALPATTSQSSVLSEITGREAEPVANSSAVSAGNNSAGADSDSRQKLESGAGSGLADSNEPAPGLGVGGSGPGMDRAILAFLDAVESHKQYPYIARRMGQEGVTTLLVELSAAGDLHHVGVIESSGVAALDSAAIEVIRRVTPFRHGLGQPLAMKIPINYRLLP